MNNHFDKRIFCFLKIIMSILLFMSSAKADDFSRTHQVTASIDLIHPHSVQVLNGESFRGTVPFTYKYPAEYAMYFTCHSESDTSFGACTTKYLSFGTTSQGSNLLLKFTNIKTRATINLTITGSWLTACGNGGDGFMGVSGACWGVGAIIFNANLSESELKKLPYGGIWKASMRLIEKNHPEGNIPFGEMTIDILLNVHSEPAISIPNSSIKLPVTMTGHSKPVTVDTCLFDGTGIGESGRYELRLDDLSGAAKGNMFALKNVTKPDAHPLYYTVSAGTPGTGGDKTAWMPGVSKVFTGMDEVPITGAVIIRGKTVPCVQWPLILKLQPFNPVRQAMGQYQGRINLLFTPSLNMP
ncbi:CfaE/CblD family pilus tip adhesin [Escherichia coli]|uniref:CfaE/CblD family pilus tip adhesin n=1 Tax=Escherichia coli TaxID=562 RepID=UPI0019B36CA3|nr:CfaE/CblD family pilus tip adhesin [Escherichia coli]CAD5740817.1 cfa/I fimbrial subunit E (colonization factor antigen I subunit E; pilin subunit) [Escherichia coli]